MDTIYDNFIETANALLKESKELQVRLNELIESLEMYFKEEEAFDVWISMKSNPAELDGG